MEYDALGLESVRYLPDIVRVSCAYAKVGWLPEVVTTHHHGPPRSLGTKAVPGMFIERTNSEGVTAA